MKNKIRRIIRSMEVLNNKRKLNVEIVLKNKIPRIKIQEKHEKKVKKITRLITAIGIIISIVSFSKWYYSLAVAIIIYIIGQIFEKIIFTYTIMLLQPFPERWDGSKWDSMIIGYKNVTPILGFGFSDTNVAIDFLNTILSWNDGKYKNEGNIVISLVLEDLNNYSVHVYPNIEREFVRRSIKETTENFKYDKYGKDQTNLVMQINFCKVFPNGPKSAYNILKGYEGEVIVDIFDTRNFTKKGKFEYFNNKEILFKSIKVNKRIELNREYDYVEYFYIPKY